MLHETEKENIAIEPHQGKSPRLNDAAPILLCQSNQTPLWIGFGCVEVGSVVTRHFDLVNPQVSLIEVAIKSSLEKSALVVDFRDIREKVVTLQPGASLRCDISWSPQQNTSLSETIELTLDMDTTLILSVHGFAGIGAVS
jgi:hypothetical protein